VREVNALKAELDAAVQTLSQPLPDSSSSTDAAAAAAAVAAVATAEREHATVSAKAALQKLAAAPMPLKLLETTMVLKSAMKLKKVPPAAAVVVLGPLATHLRETWRNHATAVAQIEADASKNSSGSGSGSAAAAGSSAGSSSSSSSSSSGRIGVALMVEGGAEHNTWRDVYLYLDRLETLKVRSLCTLHTNAHTAVLHRHTDRSLLLTCVGVM
jgi:uncharacterized membrane protein YgcG